DDEIEKEVRAVREAKLTDDEELEREILQARKSRVEKVSKLACANCGNECKSDDRFCSKCGEKLLHT
ncbi:MAG TPA: zinc-ribbon domain-containing protein, partial [Thermodesulfobacteriota bacterium]|nr:zinc-ribbon domain-containing protein [Thermodesulfobacteriota bacterium]